MAQLNSQTWPPRTYASAHSDHFLIINDTMCVHACELVRLRLLYPNIILRVHQATAWLGTFFWLKRQKEIDTLLLSQEKMRKGGKFDAAGNGFFANSFPLLFISGREGGLRHHSHDPVTVTPCHVNTLRRNARIFHNIWFYKA